MTRHQSLTEDGRGLHLREFRQQCSCGWEAPGWWNNRDSASKAWAEHVRASKQEEQK